MAAMTGMYSIYVELFMFVALYRCNKCCDFVSRSDCDEGVVSCGTNLCRMLELV